MFRVVTALLALGVSISFCRPETHDDFVRERLMEDDSLCAVAALTSAGSVCGTIHTSYNGVSFASFRGVPYAMQPLGKLRFVAPQPVQPWGGYFDASIEGPVCPQINVMYGPMMQPRSMGEDCLHVNVHVPDPEAALPTSGSECSGAACLPVLVFVHGGEFHLGSGDSDTKGPEYIMDQNVILVTLNYRLGPFGFLSLNSSSVPGNAGLRDIVAALEWVQINVRAFGGDPGRVTLMGQSAGASAVHILSLSEGTRGLFNKLILMSGTAGSGFFSTLPSYAQYLKTYFLEYLGINSTDIEETHRQLIDLPYEAILDANSKLLDSLGFCSFSPVVEAKFDGMARILDENPDILIARGRGSSYPLLVGSTNVECELMRRGFESIKIMTKIENNATAILPLKLLFSGSDEMKVAAAEQMMKRYFNGTPTLDKYIPSCSDSLFIYPALKLVETRATTGGARVFLYQFSYSSNFTPIKQAFGFNYTGAAHSEDLTYVLRVNSILQNTTLNASDKSVKDWMITIVGNFVRCSNPTCDECSQSWPAVARPLRYQSISGAAYATSDLSTDQETMVQLFDSFYLV